MKGKPAAFVPTIPLTWIFAYQYDLAYGSKMQRVRGKTLRKLAHAINRFLSLENIENFQVKICDMFLIFAQNIDCEYKLEPPC